MTDETKRVAREPTAEMIEAANEAGIHGYTGTWTIDPAKCWQVMFDVVPAAAPSNRERRLHEALRARVIDSRRCYQCHTEQAFNEPERHSPGCLAAPLPQEGE